MNKQIEEMARDLCECYNCDGTCYQDDKPCDFKCDEYTNAQYLYEKGYRKQSDGERRAKDNINGRCSIAVCSNCGTTKGLVVLLPIETVTRDFPYCEKCGAKMRGDKTDA